MRIEELKLIPPSKRSSAVLIEFMKEHEKGLKAIKTLAEIKEIAEKQCNICEELTSIDEYKDCKKCWQGKILQKINECEMNDERI